MLSWAPAPVIVFSLYFFCEHDIAENRAGIFKKSSDVESTGIDKKPSSDKSVEGFKLLMKWNFSNKSVAFPAAR